MLEISDLLSFYYVKMNTIFFLVISISVACATSLNSRIVGGKIAENGQFPYEVSLKFLNAHICGGAIINQEWILTAAHCVNGLGAAMMSIVAGTNTIKQGDGEIYRVAKHMHHENYTTDLITANYDIALIQLKTKIVFDEKVQPIPLNTEEISSGSNLVISGWGITKYPSNVPTNENVLKYLELTALNTKECQERFDELGYEVNDRQLCALARYGEGACTGDSGSPLVFDGKVAGIASWVEPCGIGYPDVYTKVSKYIDWIRDNTSPNL